MSTYKYNYQSNICLIIILMIYLIYCLIISIMIGLIIRLINSRITSLIICLNISIIIRLICLVAQGHGSIHSRLSDMLPKYNTINNPYESRLPLVCS